MVATGVAVVGYLVIVGRFGAVGAAWVGVGVKAVGAGVFMLFLLF
jgi:hypothetical protein